MVGHPIVPWPRHLKEAMRMGLKIAEAPKMSQLSPHFPSHDWVQPHFRTSRQAGPQMVPRFSEARQYPELAQDGVPDRFNPHGES